MKKLYFVLGLCAVLISPVKSQIPNSGFENWISASGYNDLEGWATANSWSDGSFYAVTKSSDHYPASVGNYSVRIETNMTYIHDDVLFGVGIVGTGNALKLGPHPVFKIIGHPTKLTGYFKYFPQGIDTCSILIQLFNNGNPVYDAMFQTNLTTSEWTSFEIPLQDYVTADSGFIFLASYLIGSDKFPTNSSVLYVDNLNLGELITSVSEENLGGKTINIYPNPASDKIVLQNMPQIGQAATIEIYNMLGLLVKSQVLSLGQTELNVSDLSNGIYSVSIKTLNLTQCQKILVKK